MFVVHPRKMRETRYFRDLFSLVLFILLLGSWFATNINAYPKSFIGCWLKSPRISLKESKTRKIISELPTINKLDSWSQYNNPEEGTEREGDIYQLPESRKQVERNKVSLWPNGIVNYYVPSSIANDPEKFTILKEALRTIMSKTCIKFARIQEYAKHPANSWVNITSDKPGCSSHLGRNIYGSTPLNLNMDECLYFPGHAIHEFLHALGVHHEHMRPDRNDYVTIIWENIQKNHTSNFLLLNDTKVTDFGLPYDYNSIMHYSMTAFSIDKSFPTIIPKSYGEVIGQRNHLSYYDIQKLRIAYNCNVIGTNKLKYNKKKFNLKIIKKKFTIIKNHGMIPQLLKWK